MLKKAFAQLGLPENSTRIYEQLLESGALTARQLAEQLSLPRPSVYDQLKLLQQQGLVVERDQENKKVFQVDDVRRLPQMIHEKVEQLAAEERVLRQSLPRLLQQSRSVEPKIKFYPGVEGVKQVMSDALWYENSEILSMWAISEMVNILGRDFHEHWHQRRIRNGISVKTIWPRDRTVSARDYPYLGTGKRFLRQQRYAPEGMTWDMGYLLYGNKVGFISSKREAFGFTLQSKEFADLIRVQFEMLWRQSTPVNVPLIPASEKFLRTI